MNRSRNPIKDVKTTEITGRTDSGHRCMRMRKAMTWIMAFPAMATCAATVDVGSRLELFVDDGVVDRTTGDVVRHLHQPKPGDVALVCDEPWEGNTSAYFTIFEDSGRYRMYYRGWHHDGPSGKPLHEAVVCYAESVDGRTWVKPQLGLVAFEGSKANNIVWNGAGTHNFTVFKDSNPACPKEARYKAIGVDNAALAAFESGDGIHWRQTTPPGQSLIDMPTHTTWWLDSQNTCIWDPIGRCYRIYLRTNPGHVRSIEMSTSEDFRRWSTLQPLIYPNAPVEHLYTNAIQQYHRAPHLFVSFPTRYDPHSQQVEPILMTSRDGTTFNRYPEAVIPLSAPRDRAQNRSNYMAWGIVAPPDEPGKLLVYATEAYYQGPGSRLRAFTYRTDGFVSLRAGRKGGTLVTQPLVFDGSRLVVNCVTRDSGRVRVEIQDAEGVSLPGFRLAACMPITGDQIAHAVEWKGQDDVNPLAGQPVRLRFELRNADLYSLQFQP